MYVDGYLLFVIYFLAASAALISVYALWTLKEIEQHYKRKSKTSNHQYQSTTAVSKPKPKSHWG